MGTTVQSHTNAIDAGMDNHIAIEVFDERVTVVALTDNSGNILERYRYRVYGEHEVLNPDFTSKSTNAISPFLWGDANNLGNGFAYVAGMVVEAVVKQRIPVYGQVNYHPVPGENDQPPVFKDNFTGPNGAIMFYRNPYYINKDPMKTLIIEGHSGRGFMFVRNPFAPGAEYEYDHTTAEKTTESKFNPGNIDPYFE